MSQRRFTAVHLGFYWRILFSMFLVLALLGVQQRAVPHALAHFGQHQGQEKAPASAEHCAQCLALSPLSGALPSSPLFFSTQLLGGQSPDSTPTSIYTPANVFPFAARAPPVLR
jgi:hypothetical protein